MDLANSTSSLAISYQDFANLSLHNLSSSIFNFPITDVYKVISENAKGSYLGRTAQIIFITIYTVLIVLGFLWNVLIVYIIVRKSELRTPRNWYIFNLTISDVAMCIICMPFTLIGLLEKNWTLGSVICKLIPAIQCGNILVSTATIVAIAADRYKTIVSFGFQNHSKINVPCTVVLIWFSSLVFTIPLFIFYRVERVMLNDIFLYDKCRDYWNPPVIKAIWTTCLLLIQYVIPIFVLAFLDVKINKFLKSNQSTQRDPRRLQREMERNKRTMRLLASVALTFAISWLPWHVANFLADFHYSGFREPEYFYSVFGGCHAIAMSTSCTNPVLYGWLNTNLNKEISDMMRSVLYKLRCKKKGTQDINEISRRRSTLADDINLSEVPPMSKDSVARESKVLSSSFTVSDGILGQNADSTLISKSEVGFRSSDDVRMEESAERKLNHGEEMDIKKYLLEENGRNNYEIT